MEEEKDIPAISTEYTLFRSEITNRIRTAQYEALKAVNIYQSSQIPTPLPS